ncbi:hypothetical protein Y032_0930g3091 [Ancylostoma ceylanicum]|uniref:Uncharacterized protein n=1 Tax=Ancylostoma ceylanicum TaxID=53326 RepID=A0A016WA41_9BILA|nr:hypothetical protein Y032_0930g3091 [Ancylostoma ceylanicum]
MSMPVAKASDTQPSTEMYTGFQTTVDKGRGRGAGTLVVCCTSRSSGKSRRIFHCRLSSSAVDIAPALIMPSTRRTTSSQATANSKTTEASPISSTPPPTSAVASPESAKEEVTLRLRSILTDKAPEALPLLD